MLTLSQLIFSWPGTTYPTLNIEALNLRQGEKVFLHGPSGSGKSTLLGLLAGITPLQSGDIQLLNTSYRSLSAAKRDKFRADHIGTLFQNFNLLPYLSPIDNVTLGCEFSKKRRAQVLSSGQTLKSEATRLLNELGIDEQTQNRTVNELSIGQQQRVAAARAIIGSPELIIADEPTSALDTDSRDGFLKLLFKQTDLYQGTVLFVSHDKNLIPLFDRHISLQDINQVTHAD